MEKTAFTMMRYENKYILDSSQIKAIRDVLKDHMQIDRYGLTSIATLYFDTPSFQLIRTSIDKPAFKEKIRLRSYGLVKDDEPLFLEIKRKVDGIVYKRRIMTDAKHAKEFFVNNKDFSNNSQINRELNYFRDYYQNLQPALLIISDREAYFKEGSDLRITIDYKPRFRSENLDLHTSMDGENLLPNDQAILEIKAQRAMPIWLSRALAGANIYKTSFSKVGAAYQIFMKQKLKKE